VSDKRESSFTDNGLSWDLCIRKLKMVTGIIKLQPGLYAWVYGKVNEAPAGRLIQQDMSSFINVKMVQI